MGGTTSPSLPTPGMGNILAAGLLLEDGWDREHLFGALAVECGLDDLARLGRTCKVALAWLRTHLETVTQAELCSLLSHMPVTGSVPWEEWAKRHPEHELGVQLIYWHNIHPEKGTHHAQIFSADLQRGKKQYRALILFCATHGFPTRTTAEQGCIKAQHFVRGMHTFASFPMFENSIITAIARMRTPATGPTDAEVVRAAKRARLQ